MFKATIGALRGFTTGRRVMSEQSELKISLITASKLPRTPNMSRTRRRNIGQREKKMKSQIIRDANNVRKYQVLNRPFDVDPVLGEQGNAFIHRVKAELEDEANLSHGYDNVEVNKLLYGAEKAILQQNAGSSLLHRQISELEAKKRSALLTVLNVKNSSEQDKKKIAINIARREFSRHEGDTASPEVIAAVLTMKIQFLMNHVKANPKDHAHTQRARNLVQKRQKILKYLKKVDSEKYFYVIKKLGLTDDVVTSEFHMDKQYLQDYKVWGDKQLVKLSEKELKQKKKMEDLQKKVAAYAELAKKKYEEFEGERIRKAEALAVRRAKNKAAKAATQ